MTLLKTKINRFANDVIGVIVENAKDPQSTISLLKQSKNKECNIASVFRLFDDAMEDSDICVDFMRDVVEMYREEHKLQKAFSLTPNKVLEVARIV